MSTSRNSAICAALLSITVGAFAGGFTPGNVVALRVGDGAAAAATNASNIFLDEFTPAAPGTLVQSIGLTTATVNPVTLTHQMSTQLEGVINVSQDGRYIVVGAYGCAAGTATPASTTADSIHRVMVRVKLSDGSVDTSLNIAATTVTGALRSAYSTNGTDFYAATYQTASPNTSQIYYTNSSINGDAIPIMTPPPVTPGLRSLGMFGGQLYTVFGISNNGAQNGLYAVGTGTPTTSNNAITTMAAGINTATAFANMEQFAFESYVPGVSGRIWIGDQAATANGALTVWDYNGTAWSKTASNFGSLAGYPGGVGSGIFTFGCALGQDTSANNVVFVTVGSANPNNSIRMVRRTDSSTNYTVSQASTGSTLVSTYRGLVVVPPVTAVRDWKKY